MTRVDFYLLPGCDPTARQVFTCRLAEKAWKAGHQVFIFTADLNEARSLDDLLWTFRQGSFVPHALADNHPGETRSAVLIGMEPPPQDCHDLLINLASGIPEDWQEFVRIVEIVNDDTAIRQAGREKYRRYHERLGVEPHTHKMT